LPTLRRQEIDFVKEKGRQKLPAFQEEPEKSWGGQG